MKEFNVAVVGATGMVGNKFLEVLAERKLPVKNYYLYASSRSAGKVVRFMDKDYTVIELTRENILDKQIDFALFSAGGATSKEFAPIFAGNGSIVVDNSSQWRTDPLCPLVVPEVNGEDALNHPKNIIANPNCSTIQAVVALKPLYDTFGIKRIIYSTYQAVSGAGIAGYNDLKNGIEGKAPEKFPYPIFGNVLPHIDSFLPNGYTKEEEKMIFETKKIFHDFDLKVTATTVRVPVFHSHSESINVEMKKPCSMQTLRDALSNQKGLVVYDDTSTLKYPMPIMAENHDEVFVGRIRVDETVESGCNIWVVADNIRKGAATNAIQIVEFLIQHQA